MKSYKYQVAGYDKAGGLQIEKWRKWNLRLSQKELAAKIGVSKVTWIARVKGRKAWQPMEVSKLVAMGAKPTWFSANI